MSEIGLPLAVGSRVVVTGMTGAGKSTFSRALSAKTGLPVICLDLHSWNPGWVRTPEDEFREKQRALLAGEKWIVDGNVALDLRFERADTLVFLDTPWWICARRAFVRGFRRPRESLSIVPRLTGLSRHRKVSVERRRYNSPLQRLTARFAGSSPLSSPSRYTAKRMRDLQAKPCGADRFEAIAGIVELVVVGTLSVGCVAGTALCAIREPEPADAIAAWIVVAVLTPFLFWVIGAELRRCFVTSVVARRR